MKPIQITSENYETEIKNSDKPVLLEFYADWCPTCRMFTPVMNQLASEVTNTKIAKVNVDDEKALVTEYGVSSIPAVIIIKNGERTALTPGYIKKEELIEILNK